MPTGHVFMAMSLDGFVARQDHALDWLMKQKTGGEEHGFEDFYASVDGMVMGSGSFRTVLSFDAWPYEKPVFVMSQSMTQSDVPEGLRDKVHVTDQDPRALMTSLETESWKRVYVDGGKVVQTFMRERLIDDMTVTLVPILIGDGIRLFGGLDGDIDLDLIEAKSFPSGLVTTKYKVL